MRRIGLAVALALLCRLVLVATATPRDAEAAENTPKVALLFTGTPEAEISGANPKSPSAKGFLEGLRELGWIDGQNIAIERRSALGDPDRYQPLIHEMLSLKVDVLVISGASPFVIAAQRATRTIPIVMAGLSGDPLELGLAKSYATRWERDGIDVHGGAWIGRQAARIAQGNRPRYIACSVHCPDRRR